MIEIIHDKVLSVTTESPDDITTIIPQSKFVDNKVLVKFDLGNAFILKNLGFEVPSPIERQYNWPGMYKPFAHQRSIASFLTLNRRAYNFGDLGIGKTCSAIWAADYLLGIGAIRRVLVIAPLSILDSAWKQEIFRTVMHRSVDVAHGTREKREAVINSKAEFILINYDGVEIVIDALDKSKFDLIIIDECFVAGTRVLTPTGFKVIEQIVEGDIIETSWGPKPVTKTFHKQSSNLVEVEFEEGTKITCTEEHPFATSTGWVAAKDLLGEVCTTSKELPHLWNAVRAGQEERGVASGLRVVGVTRIQQRCPRDVWNLEVAGPHDYIVEGVLVHNCNYIKNVQTRKHRFINKLIKADTWCWLMTATPAAQSPCDAYGLARMLDPKSVPRSYGAFRDMVQYKINMFVWVNKLDAERTVHRVLQPAIRFTKSECLDLPELLYETREVPLTAQQNKYYKLLKKEMLILAAGTTVTAANAAVLIGKLLQISAGNCYDERGDIIEFDITNRFKELCDIIHETRNKTIVFVQFRNSIERIMRMLNAGGITCEAIHGKIPMNKRDIIFSDFQNKPDPQVLIIQPQAAAHGVTLTKADTTVWFGVPMSFEVYQQGNGRTHRAGQKNQCTVVHLIGSDVEKKVLNALDKKNMSATTLLALFKEVIK